MPVGRPRFPFRHLEPTFFAGLLDDPLLLVRVRPAGRNLLFDCGQLHHLAKRLLTTIAALFVSHSHMDHWMGIDSLIRHLHASPKSLDIYGPPGLADKLEHKLAGYDWNLAEEHWATFRAHEISAERLASWEFSGPLAFRRSFLNDLFRMDDVVYETPYLRVSAAVCEHRVPSLIYRLDEQPSFLVDPEKLQRLELIPGPWLGELKRRFFQGDEGGVLEVLRRDGTLARFGGDEIVQLRDQLLRAQPPAAIGYVSDVGYTAENRHAISELLQGVDLLCCECTFLAAGEAKARASSHLCTSDVNQLLAALRPRFFLPMHLSKTYSRRTLELYRELRPPPETTVLCLPPQITPRPLLSREVGWRVFAP